jgi:hypothetical protein
MQLNVTKLTKHNNLNFFPFIKFLRNNRLLFFGKTGQYFGLIGSLFGLS